jgi:hypothetical protein
MASRNRIIVCTSNKFNIASFATEKRRDRLTRLSPFHHNSIAPRGVTSSRGNKQIRNEFACKLTIFVVFRTFFPDRFITCRRDFFGLHTPLPQ